MAAARCATAFNLLDRLLPGIRRSHPGEFYDAEGPTYGPSGEAHYHLKWMTPDGASSGTTPMRAQRSRLRFFAGTRPF